MEVEVAKFWDSDWCTSLQCVICTFKVTTEKNLHYIWMVRQTHRPSKCLQHHQQRWCKILLIDFLFQISYIFCYKLVVMTYFYFPYLIIWYYLAVLYSIVFKAVLVKYIWLNTSFCCNLNIDKIDAFFLRKFCSP